MAGNSAGAQGRRLCCCGYGSQLSWCCVKTSAVVHGGTKSCGTITVEVLAAFNVGLGCCCRLEIMADVESGSVSQGLRMTRSWQPWVMVQVWALVLRVDVGG
uniref:Uncharacterized protein n=1 Tax=Populus trichocarpa TaxID=3694 RepID=U7DWX3_POPTR